MRWLNCLVLGWLLIGCAPQAALSVTQDATATPTPVPSAAATATGGPCAFVWWYGGAPDKQARFVELLRAAGVDAGHVEASASGEACVRGNVTEYVSVNDFSANLVVSVADLMDRDALATLTIRIAGLLQEAGLNRVGITFLAADGQKGFVRFDHSEFIRARQQGMDGATLLEALGFECEDCRPMEPIATLTPTSTATPLPVTLTPPPADPLGMVVYGRAGYVAGIPNPNSPQEFSKVFVGAWRQTWRGDICEQTLGATDGSFVLTIPAGCFQEGESVYLTAGGLATCVTVPFHVGTRVSVELLGRWDETCP
jgi:hypothetical protein